MNFFLHSPCQNNTIRITEDNSSQESLKNLLNFYKYMETRTTPYHLQSNGLTEQFYNTLLPMLSTTVADHPWDWADCLSPLCYVATLVCLQARTAFLMSGYQVRLPVDLAFNMQPLLLYIIIILLTCSKCYKNLMRWFKQQPTDRREFTIRKLMGVSIKKEIQFDYSIQLFHQKIYHGLGYIHCS